MATTGDALHVRWGEVAARAALGEQLSVNMRFPVPGPISTTVSVPLMAALSIHGLRDERIIEQDS